LKAIIANMVLHLNKKNINHKFRDISLVTNKVNNI